MMLTEVLGDPVIPRGASPLYADVVAGAYLAAGLPVPEEVVDYLGGHALEVMQKILAMPEGLRERVKDLTMPMLGVAVALDRSDYQEDASLVRATLAVSLVGVGERLLANGWELAGVEMGEK